TQVCGISNIGACKLGTQTCVNGQWASCTGSVNPTAEICNAADDDCDGLTDENLYQQCGSNVGICQYGQQQCSNGAWGSCLGGINPTNETCNILDDNCNGQTDENRVCNQASVIQAIPTQNVFENQSFSFAITVTDPDGDTTVVTPFNLPSGSTFDAVNRIFSWLPNFNQVGNYAPYFTAADGLVNSAPATATINVGNLNRMPLLDAITNKTGAENQLIQFNISAIDPDSDALTYSAVNLPAGAVFNATTRTFAWTPSFAQAGTYNITFNVTDSSLWNDNRIFIIINDTNQPPIITIANLSVQENNTLQFILNVSEPDNSTITAVMTNLPPGANFSNATKLFNWTPAFNQSGAYMLTVNASDGLLSAFRNFTIFVNNTNRMPLLDAMTNKTGAENQTVQFAVNATDPDNDALNFSAANLPAGAVFNATTRTFTWTPSFAQAGYYNVTFNVTDGLLWNNNLIFINISNVNAPPMIVIADQSIFENNTLQFTINISEPDNETVSASIITLPFGANFSNATKLFNWTPNLTQSGVYMLTVNASDGIVNAFKNFTILINNTNRLPVLLNFSPINDTAISENQSQNFTTNVSDPDNDVLAINWYKNGTQQTNYTNSTLFVFLTDFTSSGLYNITVSISDSLLSIFKNWFINVTNVNAAPIINTGEQSVYENSTLSFVINITEPDGQNYTINVSDIPAGAVFNYTISRFNWTPNFTQAGYYNITVNATDGALNATKIITIIVNNTNRAPSIFNYSPDISFLNISEGSSINFTVNVSDPDSDAVNVIWYKNGTIILNGTANNFSSINFTTNFSSQGIYNFTAVATDGNLSDKKEWSLNVTNINQAPAITPAVGNKTVQKTFQLIFFVNATDPDNDAINVSAQNLPFGAVFSTGTKIFSWTPNSTQVGIFNVTFNVSDGQLSYAEMIFITVQDIFISQINTTLLADGYVSSRYPNTAFGTGNLKLMDYPTEKQRIFLKFDASQLLGKQISNAVLTLSPIEDYSNSQQKKLYFVGNDAWSEATLTWNSMPDNSTLLASNTSNSFAFSSSLISADATVTLMIQFNEANSYAKMTFGSREAGIKPVLMVNFIANDSNAPQVSLQSPTNGILLPEQNVTFSYIVNDESLILNCSLLINGSINQTSTSIQSGTTQIFTKYMNNGSYSWNVQCFDSFQNPGNATARLLAINGTVPLVLKNAIIYPSADAFVSSRYPNSVFNNNYLKIMDYPTEKQRTYIRFSTAQFIGKNVTSAVLYLTPEVDAGNGYIRELYFVSDDTWSESSVTWNTKPASAGLITSGLGHSWNVLNSNFNDDGTYSMLLMFIETNSYAKIIYGSKEIGTSPYISISYYDLP
ncbi:MAG TPA: putative Ig domain-containing protein, partial [Candidatus Nanoarchaeia archaeon]|nr:putative Ig domain-containing protein [Candidatus Nanoarchaeia archaeon]